MKPILAMHRFARCLTILSRNKLAFLLSQAFACPVYERSGGAAGERGDRSFERGDHLGVRALRVVVPVFYRAAYLPSKRSGRTVGAQPELAAGLHDDAQGAIPAYYDGRPLGRNIAPALNK
jgi:hypothetical protein